MNRKTLIIGGAVCAAALAAAYLGSPFLAIHGLRDAAASGNRDRLERAVDFPSVRESLKSQLQTMMMAHLQADPEMQANPFSGLAVMMIPTVVNNAVDVYVTPDSLASLVRGQKPAEPGSEPVAPSRASEETDVKATYRYVDLNTFRTEITDGVDDPIGMVMHREGLFSWKLKRIELPADLMDRE